MSNNDKNTDTPNIVTQSSQGYGYTYASLGDMARQGVPIPKMTTRVVENGGEYIYYWDKELSEWVQGARVVIPIMKSVNEAQAYGSALTYARRYTVALANGIVTDDDNAIEKTPPRQQAQARGQGAWRNAPHNTTQPAKNTAPNAKKTTPRAGYAATQSTTGEGTLMPPPASPSTTSTPYH